MKDIVYDICERMLEGSPERSYKRLNPALRSTLMNCIEADLPFRPDTFGRIYKSLRGSWWFGDGAGSHIGEHFYSAACSLNHASAQQSFEAFAKRPAVLWEENAKTPERLHVGSQFTWQGRYVTVTSMREDSLVACTYKDYRSTMHGLKVGATVGYDPEYVITSSKKVGNSHSLTVQKAPKTSGEREIAKRFVIHYAAIATLRRTAKARVKAVLDKIASCDPEKDAQKLTAEINAEHFRHFELEEINAAFGRRKEFLANESAIQAWRDCKHGAWIAIKGIALRVNGDLVECSNGNSVSRAAVERALPAVLANRNQSLSLSIPLDHHQINRVGSSGVKVGCTLVPWSEVEFIASQLKT